MRFFHGVLAAAFGLALMGQVEAGKLQIAPVSIDVPAPGAASSVTLTNTGRTVMAVQARIFRWSQGKRGERFHNTKNVVVSPPIVKLRPGKKAVVRIVRLSKKPVNTEENYRLLIDEIPSKARTNRSTVRMVMRYSLPVFFGPGEYAKPKTAWNVYQRGGKLIVAGANYGQTRLKLSQMRVVDGRGRAVDFGKGLNGYVLSQSSKTFYTNSGSRLRGRRVTITAQSNYGPFKAVAQLK